MIFMKGIIIVCKVIHVDTLFITASDRLRISLDMNPSLLPYTDLEKSDFSQILSFFGLGESKSFFKPGWLVIGEFDIGIAPGRFWLANPDQNLHPDHYILVRI